jgi:D-glycero-alpha-D-manno-heptose 1-phosphate guanylyltransferase
MTTDTALTCVILAGGLGTRLRGVVGDRPKCLAPVGSRTFLDIQLESLFAAGVSDMVLSLGHGAAQVIAATQADAAGRPIHWVVEPELLGTGGAIAYTLDALGLDEVWVANGDTFLEADLSPMREPLDRSRGELLRIALVYVADRGRFGGVQSNEDDVVSGFLEKGHRDSGWINAGLYRLARAALPAARKGAYSLESDVLPGLVARGAVRGCRLRGHFVDIGVPEDYHRFCTQHAG